MALLGGKTNKFIENKRVKDLTIVTWEVGPFKEYSLGQAIESPLVNAGTNEWRFTLFPKGLTLPDAVSLYITNMDALLDDGDPLDRKKVTTLALANIKVTFSPNSMPKEDDKKDDGKDEKKEKDASSAVKSGSSSGSKAGAAGGSSISKKSAGKAADETVSVKSGKSNRSSSTRASGASQSSSISKSGSKGGAGGGGKKSPPPQAEIVKTLSSEFTNLNPSWGFEEWLDMSKVYNPKSMYMGNIPKDGEVQNGTLTFTIELLAATGLKVGEPESDPGVTAGGKQRTRWKVQDLKDMISKVAMNQKVTSSVFESDGEWYFAVHTNTHIHRHIHTYVCRVSPFMKQSLNRTQNHEVFTA
jgi:hypothetical protein